MSDDEDRKIDEFLASLPQTPNPRDIAALDELLGDELVEDDGPGLVVCRAFSNSLALKKEDAKPWLHALGNSIQLIAMPDLDAVRRQLIAEFPYAATVANAILRPIRTRETVRIRPTLLIGDPGGGKTRFARRLGELLEVPVWRVDAAQATGNSFAGLERRWTSAEPCAPFVAIARHRVANPIVLLDEIEKASTRTDTGRLWDALLGFLETENAARYPDPYLQTDIDLSQVSYIATANREGFDQLPPPLVDRFRVINFPSPTAADFDALIGPAMRQVADDWTLDDFDPLEDFERETVLAAWNGGSVRKLKDAIEAVFNARADVAEALDAAMERGRS